MRCFCKIFEIKVLLSLEIRNLSNIFWKMELSLYLRFDFQVPDIFILLRQGHLFVVYFQIKQGDNGTKKQYIFFFVKLRGEFHGIRHVSQRKTHLRMNLKLPRILEIHLWKG